MALIIAMTLLLTSVHAYAGPKFDNLKIRCESHEDGQIIEVFRGHVIRLEDGSAEADYYRVTEIKEDETRGELVFTGLRTNDFTAVTNAYKGPPKTIVLQHIKGKFWKVVTKLIVADKKDSPYVLIHSCKED